MSQLIFRLGQRGSRSVTQHMWQVQTRAQSLNGKAGKSKSNFGLIRSAWNGAVVNLSNKKADKANMTFLFPFPSRFKSLVRCFLPHALQYCKFFSQTVFTGIEKEKEIELEREHMGQQVVLRLFAPLSSIFGFLQTTCLSVILLSGRRGQHFQSRNPLVFCENQRVALQLVVNKGGSQMAVL